jgi:hypothetical protein
VSPPTVKTRAVYSAELLARLCRRFRAHPDVRKGKMFGYPAFYIGRRMIACVYQDEIGLKLPAARVDKLLERGDLRSFRPYGKAAMREWISVGVALAPTPLASALYGEAIEFGRKPK